MVSYDFYTGEYIKEHILREYEFNDYVFDDSIKNMKLDDCTMYGVHITRIRKEGIFWNDTYKVDFIEEVPKDILNLIAQHKELTEKIKEFKENRRTCI